jgi:hypothetical protein
MKVCVFFMILLKFGLDSCLHHAEIEFTIDLIQSPCLRSLTVQFWREPQNPQYLSHLLSEVVACEIEEIVVGLFLSLGETDVVDWNHVDAILAQPQFSKLRSFRICTNSDDSAWFIDHLPRCYARGILSIQSLLWELTIL